MSTLTIPSPDGAFSAYVARPAIEPAPVIVLIHEIFGVNADLRLTADELAAQGFIAVCPGLFWRQAADVDLDPSAAGAFERGVDLYQAFDFDKGVIDIGATLEAVKTLPGSNGHSGLMGFCMGGLLTFLAAARIGPEAAVAYYGGGTEEHLAEAAAVQTPMLMHLGEDDEYISATARGEITTAFAGNPHVEIHTYPGQGHAFARHQGARYDAEAALLANRRTMAFFRRLLA